jgi:hypothetical protein
MRTRSLPLMRLQQLTTVDGRRRRIGTLIRCLPCKAAPIGSHEKYPVLTKKRSDSH